jgi:putative Mn2+ efflux pump MntP
MIEVVILAFALSMDAFAVSVYPQHKKRGFMPTSLRTRILALASPILTLQLAGYTGVSLRK